MTNKELIPDGLYRVVTPYLCAGFVVEEGSITRCAPILRKRITYWITKAMPQTQEKGKQMNEKKLSYTQYSQMTDEQTEHCLYNGSMLISIDNLTFHLYRLLNQESVQKLTDLIRRFEICLKGLHFTGLTGNVDELDNFTQDFANLVQKVELDIIPECKQVAVARQAELEKGKQELH